MVIRLCFGPKQSLHVALSECLDCRFISQSNCAHIIGFGHQANPRDHERALAHMAVVPISTASRLTNGAAGDPPIAVVASTHADESAAESHHPPTSPRRWWGWAWWIVHNAPKPRTRARIITETIRRAPRSQGMGLRSDTTEFPFAVLCFTGSKDFNPYMRLHCNTKFGWSLSDKALAPYIRKGKEKAVSGVSTPCRIDASTFGALKMDFIPPTARDQIPAVYERTTSDNVEHSTELMREAMRQHICSTSARSIAIDDAWSQ
jgi:hypothetical protein